MAELEFYNSKHYTAEEVDERLFKGTYDDAVKAGFKGSKEEFDSQIARAVSSGESTGNEEIDDAYTKVISEAIRKVPQTLTEAEKTQARTNINAVGKTDIVNNLITGGADKALSAEMGKVLKNGSLPVLQASNNMLNNAQHTGVYIIDQVKDSPGKSTYYMCIVRRSSTKFDDYCYCIEQVIYSLDESIPEVFSRIAFVTEDGVEFGNWNALDTTSLKERSYDQGISYEVGIIKSADGFRSYPLEKIFFSGTLLGTTASSATATLQVSKNYLMPYSLQGSVLLYKEDGSFQIYLLKDMEKLEYEFTIEDGILLLRLDAFPIFDNISGISRVQYFVEVTTTGLNVLP